MASKVTEPIVYFIDRNLGKTAGKMLQDAGALVELHDNHFAQDTKDAELLAKIGERGWLFITKDKRIRYRSLERDAALNANLRVFVLAATKNSTGKQLGELLVRHRAKIERTARKQPPPFIAGVYESGIMLYELTKWDDNS